MKGKGLGMDDQMTAEREQDGGGGTRHEFSRARLWLMVGLPSYAAVTAAVMTAVFVAIPFYLYMIADEGGNTFGLAILGVTAFSSPLISGAVVLALNMHAVLNHLHLQDAPRDEKSHTFCATLHSYTQARSMLMFSGRLPIWRAVLWSAGAFVVSVFLLGAGVLVVNLLLVLLLLSLGSFVPILLYSVALAAAGLALAVSIAAALRRMLLKRRDKWILKIALVAVACATAGAATVAVAALIGYTLRSDAPIILIWAISILLQILGFLLLPRLLRASAAYARLQNTGGSAPGA